MNFLRNTWLILKHAVTKPNKILVIFEDGTYKTYDPKEYEVKQTVEVIKKND